MDVGTIAKSLILYADRVYMWTNDDIGLDLLFVEHEEMIVRVTTPAGSLELAGSVSRKGRTLHVEGAHVQGLHPGALGRGGLNAIGRKLMELADVDQIIIQGGVRSTGCNRGRAPRPFRFPSS